jgi:hypothetical protein
MLIGAPGRNRTDTSVKIPDFESGASTSSTTGAQDERGATISIANVRSISQEVEGRQLRPSDQAGAQAACRQG